MHVVCNKSNVYFSYTFLTEISVSSRSFVKQMFSNLIVTFPTMSWISKKINNNM